MAIAFDLRRSWRDLGRVLFGAAVSVATGAAIVISRWGALLGEILARGGSETGATSSIFAAPGSALVGALADPATPAWKIPYVLSHVALLVVGIVLLWLESRKLESGGGAFETRALAGWCLLQLLFQLTLRGTQGFDDFPRYMTLVLPALALAYRRYLPRSIGVFIVVALLSPAVALDPALRNSRASCGSSSAATAGGA